MDYLQLLLGIWLPSLQALMYLLALLIVTIAGFSLQRGMTFICRTELTVTIDRYLQKQLKRLLTKTRSFFSGKSSGTKAV